MLKPNHHRYRSKKFQIVLKVLARTSAYYVEPGPSQMSFKETPQEINKVSFFKISEQNSPICTFFQVFDKLYMCAIVLPYD